MQFNVDKTTIEYIKQKGKIINIDLYSAKSCWIKILEPNVNFGKPKLLQKFNEYKIDDITIYVNKYIEPKEESLTIKLSKFLGIKNLSVYGVKM